MVITSKCARSSLLRSSTTAASPTRPPRRTEALLTYVNRSWLLRWSRASTERQGRRSEVTGGACQRDAQIGTNVAYVLRRATAATEALNRWRSRRPSLWRFRLKIHRRGANRKGLTAGRTGVLSAPLGSCAPTRGDSSGQPLLGQDWTTNWSKVDCSEAN
jgi:hypothetical protein